MKLVMKQTPRIAVWLRKRLIHPKYRIVVSFMQWVLCVQLEFCLFLLEFMCYCIQIMKKIENKEMFCMENPLGALKFSITCSTRKRCLTSQYTHSLTLACALRKVFRLSLSDPLCKPNELRITQQSREKFHSLELQCPTTMLRFDLLA